jgi:hypothetical protein
MFIRNLILAGICLCGSLFSSGQLQLEICRDELIKKRTHTELINYLVEKNGYNSYLEIGVMFRWCNIDKINCQRKIGVDPNPNSNPDFLGTSDAFFRKNRETFDIIFIDGLHLHEQTLRDITNALKVLNPGGIIVMHDCLPTTARVAGRSETGGPWTGDVWKAAAFVRMNFDHVQLRILDMDWGCGILEVKYEPNLYPNTPLQNLDWNFFVQNRDELLNVTSLEDWLGSH